MITSYKDAKTTQPLPGVTRRVLAHSPGLMLAEHILEKGSILPRHNHPHAQLVYLVSGKLLVVIDGTEYTISPGDSFVLAPNMQHEVIARERSVALDIFSPARTDFL
jgi:quercetin dioxygenase-like cupin family protein